VNVTSSPSPWPFRLALATAACAVPLVLFGGSVTTIGAGMAVDGWLIAEGHFLVLFPIESWFRDTATFVEHTHRLFGVLVGLFAVATLLAALRFDRRRRARALALLSLLAVGGQGAVGGLRVLEDSPRFAFLHGALAQAVLALLCCTAVYLSPRWTGRRGERALATANLRLAATWTTLAVYAQVVAGAWYRHALRPAATPESAPRFLVHVVLAFVVVALVLSLARSLDQVGSAPARRLRNGLLWLLGIQVALGLLALIGHRPGAVGPIEWTLSIAHVLGGGLLLFQAARARMWASGADPGRSEPTVEGRYSALEGRTA